MDVFERLVSAINELTNGLNNVWAALANLSIPLFAILLFGAVLFAYIGAKRISYVLFILSGAIFVAGAARDIVRLIIDFARKIFEVRGTPV